MASSKKLSFHQGYRNWFQSYRYGKQMSIPIFILDFEPDSHWEDQYEGYSEYEEDNFKRKSRLINGIQIYFLDEKNIKRKAFLRHEPYFYLITSS